MSSQEPHGKCHDILAAGFDVGDRGARQAHEASERLLGELEGFASGTHPAAKCPIEGELVVNHSWDGTTRSGAMSILPTRLQNTPVDNVRKVDTRSHLNEHVRRPPRNPGPSRTTNQRYLMAPNTEKSTGQPPVTFTIDGVEFTVDDRRQPAADLLRLAGLDPTDYDLLRIVGKDNEKRFHDQDIVEIVPHGRYVSFFTGSTPVE